MLSGVTFDVYNSKGQLIDSGTTGSNGLYKPNIYDADGNIILDTYVVKERITNPGYQYTEPTTQQVTITEGINTTPINTYFRDFPSKTITIYKEDAQTGEPIPGCEYEIVQIDGKGTWRSVGLTGSKGEITWKDVLPGTYMVREVSTVAGYILDQTPQYVTVINGQAPSLKFLDSKLPGLSISKIDAQTGVPIMTAATFRVEQIDGSYSEDVSTSGGKASLTNLPVGSYTIKELSAPDGWVIDETIGTVHLAENASVQYNHYNLKMPILTIEKVDGQTGAPIPGTRFEIKKADGTIYGTVTTGNDGKVTAGNMGHELGYLSPGVYTVTEVFVPEPYVLSGEHQDIELKGGDTKSLFFNNLEMPQIVIEKYDEKTAEMLPDAQFAIYEQHDMARPVVEGVTDRNGKLESGFIPPGTYVIQELNPPPGYMFSDKTPQTRTIVAKAGDGVITVKFDNVKLPQLTIKKIDAITGEPIQGVTYTVEQTDSTSFQPATATTNAQGLITIPGLEAGTYTITEISCPSRYILNSEPQNVRMDGGDEKTVLFENTLFPTLVIEKIDYTTFKPVPQTTFKVEYENSSGGIEPVGTYRTDENGRIVLPYVKQGWYILTETIPAQGMSTPSNPVTRIYLAPGTNSYTDTSNGNIGGNGVFTVSDGLDYPVVAGVPNYPLNSIVIKKVNAITGEMLPGATFELIRVTGEMSGQNGQTLGTFITGPSGVLVITGLEAGGYAVREIQAPPNYTLSENSLQNGFLKADGTSILEFSFHNYPFGTLLVTKVDAKTSAPLENARFKVTDSGGAVVGNENGIYVTDMNGEFVVPNLTPGSYVVTELTAPAGYVKDPTPQTIDVNSDGKIYKLTFHNEPEGSLVILKKDSVTREPLENAEFKVTTSTGAVVGTTNGIFKTDMNGTITISNLVKGTYLVEEIKAPDGYVLENQSKTIDIDYGKTYTLEFANKKMSSLQVVKIDAATKRPLKDAQFKIYKMSGELLGTYTTDGDGLIILDNLDTGWYKALESRAPLGYQIDDTPQDFQIIANQFVKLTFENKKLTSLIVKKVDDKSGEPLAGAVFTVERQNGEFVGEYSTDSDGTINIPTLDPDWYIIREKRAPDGYKLDESPKTVQVKTDVPTVVTFTNKKLTGLEIKKVDEKTGAPLAGARFTVERQNGEKVYTSENGTEFTTDGQGLITIPNLTPDYYIVREMKAPDGYLLDETPKTVEVKTVSPTTVTFSNKKLTSLQIKKIDELTGEPLPGARFTVEKQNGETVYTNESGTEFTTDAQGFINIPNLDPDYYIVKEVKQPEGYILDETPKTVQVKTDAPTTVTFGNMPLAGLKIIKINSETRSPISGVEFSISKMNGEKVQNDYSGYTFTTDSTGQIYIPSLPDGIYMVSETKAASGYALDAEPKTIEVKAGKIAILEVENRPESGLLIIKTDAQTGKPLKGVVFDVRRADGQRVSGYLVDGNQPDTPNNNPNKTTSPNGDISGSYTTDANGRILINNLAPGEYHIVETKELSGYERDTDVHSVTVTPGKQAVARITNIQKAGIRILKIDSTTKKPIFGAEFMLFDDRGTVVGTFRSDNNGIVDFAGAITPGRYTVRETKPADGYYHDDVPRTVQFVSGKYTEIVWENIPCMAQIQITKLSADDNQINGLPEGTPLEGAIFEVFAYKSGNLVDRFVTASNGIGVSKPLPLGRYTVKEAQAPAYYQLNTKELDITLEFATQIIKLEYTDRSANTGVTIRKTGNLEAMPGDTIRYDIKTVRNDSTIPVTDFYWRDVLPVDAVRLTKIVSGTYNQALRYKVMATTNKGNTKVIADNLSTTVNNVIDCSNASLGLYTDEFITSFTFVFGNVKAGFTCVEQPQVFVTVNKTLPSGYTFANKADVGGKTGNEWIISNSTWSSSIYRGTNSKLPKTGY